MTAAAAVLGLIAVAAVGAAIVAWSRTRAAEARLADLDAILARRSRELARLETWRVDLVSALVNPALLFSDEDRLTACNQAARELLRLPEDTTDVTITRALGSNALVGAVTEARSAVRPIQIDATLTGDREVRGLVSQVAGETLVVLTDRTRERRIAALRRDFVVNASHELKTPATAIQTLSEAIELTLDRDPDRSRQLVARLGEESERLVRLVHDLLDLRRLEEGEQLDAVPVDVTALTREILAEMDDSARRREVEVGLEAPEAARLVAIRDDVRLIVRNLVANAIQYNQPGGRVDVAIVRRGDAYELVVADTGIGIPQQDVTRVFERFYRVDAARSRGTGGTGLGLAIVRHAVERHGGSIRVDSLLGEGTTVTVHLPVEPRP